MHKEVRSKAVSKASIRLMLHTAEYLELVTKGNCQKHTNRVSLTGMEFFLIKLVAAI